MAVLSVCARDKIFGFWDGKLRNGDSGSGNWQYLKQLLSTVRNLKPRKNSTNGQHNAATPGQHNKIAIFEWSSPFPIRTVRVHFQTYIGCLLVAWIRWKIQNIIQTSHMSPQILIPHSSTLSGTELFFCWIRSDFWFWGCGSLLTSGHASWLQLTP